VFAALYFIVLLVDLLEMYCVYANRDDPEDEQFTLNREPFAPALRNWRAARHDPRQWPNNVTVKRAFLNFVPRFGRGTIQDRRDIYYYRLASRGGAGVAGALCLARGRTIPAARDHW
jgi:hypothetical protein